MMIAMSLFGRLLLVISTSNAHDSNLVMLIAFALIALAFVGASMHAT